MSKWLSVGVIALVGLASVVSAQEPADKGDAGRAPRAGSPPSPALVSQLCKIDLKGDKKDQWMRLPQAESSVTQHRLNVGGKSIDYTATAGTLIVRDEEDKPMASMGYVAYVRRDGKGGAARPVTFAFNGGPGSSSLWLHMGVL